MVNDLFAFAPELVLVLVGILLPVLGASGWSRHALAWLTAIAIAASGILVAATVAPVPGLESLQFWHEGSGAAVVYSLWSIEPFAALFKWVFLGVAFIVTLSSPSYMRDKHQGEYYGLLLLATVGMMATASSRDLITLFLGLETASFATYALAAWFKRAPDSAESSVKYFIIGSLSSSITLFGIAIMYGLTGFYGTPTLTFEGIAQATANISAGATQAGGFAAVYPNIFVFSYLFLLTGFGFKVASVPFHMWAPDVYQGSPTPVSAFLAAGSKKMGFVGLFKIFLVGILAAKSNWVFILSLVAIVTMTWGNLIALRQDNLKRLLAWSSVAHAGYILMAIPIATHYAVAGGMFHIMTHAAMKVGAFAAIAAITTVGIGESMKDWRGVGRRAPLIALSMAILMVSFAGLPPLGGFASKFVLFSAAISAGGWFVALAVAGILNSAVSLYYYARVIRTMYVDEGEPVGPYVRSLRIPVGATLAVVIATGLVILMGIWPEPFVEYSKSAAAALLG